MIIFDTETTGLIKPELCELSEQPYITEIFCLKVDDEDLTPHSAFETMVKPPIPISEEITKITGITDADVASAPEFVEVYPGLAEFFLGERVVCAHNLAFDRGMLSIELQRIERETCFPFAIEQLCTAERSILIEGRRLGLKDLYKRATGREIQGHHRARNDVESLLECVKWMRGEGLI